MKITAHKLLELIRPLFVQLGEHLLDISFVNKGSSCEVWFLVSNVRNYALRIFEDQVRVLDGQIDSFIRNEVLYRGGAVVVPVLDSESSNLTLYGRRWSLEPFVEGLHPRRGELSKATCSRLGETIAALHDLSARKFGLPIEVSSQIVVGSKVKQREGVAQRFENPIPETWTEGFAHPILSEAPELSERVLARLREVSEHINHSQPVVCHSDLHEKQLICSGDHLRALIDFGSAAVLDRHWDLGSILYFHGKDVFSDVFEAYTGNFASSQSSTDIAASFSVAIAMHHASRSRLPGKQHRLENALNHIRQTV